MAVPTRTVEEELLSELKLLSELLWENRCPQPVIDRWLSNFTGVTNTAEVERLHALHLLASVSYFGLRELRVLLRSLYRDIYRYPLVQQLRSDLGGTRDANLVQQRFADELAATRFIGMGNPAESGTHLLYYFRQENGLRKDLFVGQHELLDRPVSDSACDFRDPAVHRYVFIDDLCGSGQQAISYSSKLLSELRIVAKRRQRPLELHYYLLFAHEAGLQRARALSNFDVVDCVHVLDDTYQAFSNTSRIYQRARSGLTRATGESMAMHYGMNLEPAHPLGYGNLQLLLAFHHNIPDNSLPILWYDERDVVWEPILKRYAKVYA